MKGKCLMVKEMDMGNIYGEIIVGIKDIGKTI